MYRPADEVYEDALEYPFISTLLAPFGPDAILPFEEHLRSLHRDYSQRHGGSWYKMTSARKARSKLAEVTEGPNELIEEGRPARQPGTSDGRLTGQHEGRQLLVFGPAYARRQGDHRLEMHSPLRDFPLFLQEV